MGGYVGAPYVKGSETSREAAERKVAGGGKDADELRVLQRFANLGAYGSTDKETEAALGMSHENVSARRKGLVDDALVERTQRVRPTPSGGRAGVYVITQRGYRVLGDRELARIEGRRWQRKDSGLVPRARKDAN